MTCSSVALLGNLLGCGLTNAGNALFFRLTTLIAFGASLNPRKNMKNPRLENINKIMVVDFGFRLFGDDSNTGITRPLRCIFYLARKDVPVIVLSNWLPTK